jgi:hypothetical protein
MINVSSLWVLLIVGRSAHAARMTQLRQSSLALERVTKAVEGGGGTPGLVANCHTRAGMAPEPADQSQETEEFRTSRLDIDNGPEVIVIERK